MEYVKLCHVWQAGKDQQRLKQQTQHMAERAQQEAREAADQLAAAMADVEAANAELEQEQNKSKDLQVLVVLDLTRDSLLRSWMIITATLFCPHVLRHLFWMSQPNN